MTRAPLATLALCAVTLAVAPSFAAGWSTFAVDDSMTQVQGPAAQLRWRDAWPSKQTVHLLDASVDVRVVLNVSPWVGKPARIYMVMPPLPQSSLTVQWASGGTLLSGRLSGGQRQLVFQGVIPGVRLEDTLHVVVTADARDPVTPPHVNFRFEIEAPNP